MRNYLRRKAKKMIFRMAYLGAREQFLEDREEQKKVIIEVLQDKEMVATVYMSPKREFVHALARDWKINLGMLEKEVHGDFLKNLDKHADRISIAMERLAEAIEAENSLPAHEKERRFQLSLLIGKKQALESVDKQLTITQN